MITVPSLDPCTDILDTDEIMITHQNGTTDTISGADFNKRNQVIISATATITGTPLKPGNVVRVLFTADQSANNGSTAMVINYNTENKTVKVCKNGALADYYAFEVNTGVYKYCQAYTVLELLYNGTNFIIMGNPVVLSGANYTIFADGLRRIDEIVNNNNNLITSNAVYDGLSNKADTQIQVSNAQYSNANDYKYLIINRKEGNTISYFRTMSYLIVDNNGTDIYLLSFGRGNNGNYVTLVLLAGTQYLTYIGTDGTSAVLETSAAWNKLYTVYALTGCKAEIYASTTNPLAQ